MFERFSQDAVKALRGRALGIATLGILLLLIVIAPPLRTALLAEGAWLVYMVSALGLLCLIAAGILLYRMLACAQAKPYRDLIASSADPEAARRVCRARLLCGKRLPCGRRLRWRILPRRVNGKVRPLC